MTFRRWDPPMVSLGFKNGLCALGRVSQGEAGCFAEESRALAERERRAISYRYLALLECGLGTQQQAAVNKATAHPISSLA